MEHGSLKRGLLTIPKREVHGNTIYDATSTLSVTVYFDAIRLDRCYLLTTVAKTIIV